MFDDDVHALTCSRDRSFLCWDLRREKRISNHTQRMGGINAIVLSRDQTQVISSGKFEKNKKKSFFEISLKMKKPKTYYTYIILFFLCLSLSHTTLHLAQLRLLRFY